jgi:hypothetical protein
MGKKISSLDLFKRLQPRFREIIWYPSQFSTEDSPVVRNRLIIQGENLLLIPGFLGKAEPISRHGRSSEGRTYSAWWARGGEPKCPAFQVRTGGLAFSFVFDPSSEEEMGRQFTKAAVVALYEGPFKGRRFFMDPKFDRPGFIVGAADISFSVAGDPIPGFYPGEATAHDWTFFIPEGPERAAVQAAVDLEDAEAVQRRYHEQDPTRHIVQGLRDKFEESLVAVDI